MVRRMIVVEYSADWPKRYEQELALLSKTLGPVLIRCHHIGSTSVPGLAAKPIIDMLLEVQSVESLDQMNEAMRDLGYQPKGEFGIPGRRYFPKGVDARTYHVHAFAAGDSHIGKHLAFRDYLRAYPEVAQAYAAVKQEASAAHGTNPEGYVAFKHEFVERTVTDAVHWMNDTE